MKSTWLIAAVAATLLTGCDKPPHQPVQEPVAEGHLLQGHQDALDKAKAVQGVVDDAAQQQQQALKEAGG
ncbi:MAG: hypothetical protein II007_07960 [Gammaproteobacteria bacterium]|nr:hypothetical protein [Gammaproteobacteria bacterium]